MVTMYPMDIEEFMLALGEKNLVIKIKECFANDKPMPTALHDVAMELFIGNILSSEACLNV